MFSVSRLFLYQIPPENPVWVSIGIHLCGVGRRRQGTGNQTAVFSFKREESLIR